MRQRSWWYAFVEQLGLWRCIERFFKMSQGSLRAHLSQRRTDTFRQKHPHQLYHWCFKRYVGATDIT